MTPHLLLTSALAAALLYGCGKSTPMSADERSDFENRYAAYATSDDFPQADEVLRHYADTQQADYRADSGLTMLHLACAEKDVPRVRRLLADKAEIHADCDDTPYKTPFLCAMRPSADGDPENTDALLDLLLQSGAYRDEADDLYLLETDEDTLLHLWDKGIRPNREEGAQAAAYQDWPELLRRMIAEGYPLNGALLATAESAAGYSENEHAEEITEELLAAGAEADEREEGSADTPLIVTARALPNPQAEGMIEQLLAHGADASACDGNGLSAADYIAAQPELAADLREKGYALSLRPLELHPGAGLAADVRRMMLLRGDPTPYADLLESAIREHSMGDDTAESMALALLAQADAARASQLAEQLLPDRPEVVTAAALCYEGGQVLAPGKAALLTALRKGGNEAWRCLPPMLARCPDADAEIDALLTDESPAVQAIAWTAKLLRAGLPVCDNNSVADWLKERGLDPGCMSSAVVQAIHLTTWEPMVDSSSEADANEKKVILRALGDLHLSPDMLKPYREDKELSEASPSEQANFQALVIAVSRFIWEHRAAFLQKEEDSCGAE